MTPGSNIPLTAARVAVDVTAPVRLDVSGLLLTADGKVRSDNDFIFYNQPTGPGVTYRSGGGTSPDAITVDTASVPPGIEKIVVTASPDAATLDAMRLAARTEGMITDPVYEGKSMAGLIDLVRRGEIGPDSTVLYAHLGGQPALNAYSALFD